MESETPEVIISAAYLQSWYLLQDGGIIHIEGRFEFAPDPMDSYNATDPDLSGKCGSGATQGFPGPPVS